MQSDSGVTVSYKQCDNGGKGMFVSGLFSSVDVIPSDGGVELEVSCWGNDSPYGMGGETYAISEAGILRGDSEAGFPQRDLHYLRLAFERLGSISPEEEPYISLRNRAMEALRPICPQS